MGRLGWILAAVGGAGALAGVAYLASGGAAQPAAGSGTTATGGTGALSVILTPGASPTIALSLSKPGQQANSISFTLPTGATGSINLITSDSTIVTSSGYTTNGTATATAVKAGSATLAAAWTDANGQSQTSSIPVTVTA
jgi:hypothetical protein